jgi:hypothetical protein
MGQKTKDIFIVRNLFSRNNLTRRYPALPLPANIVRKPTFQVGRQRNTESFLIFLKNQGKF